MTSLVSTPKTEVLEFNFHSESQADESLFAVWRRSRNPKLSRKRLSNRSWRLISERVLNVSQKAIHQSLLTLEDNPLTSTTSSKSTIKSTHKLPHMLPARPSLFLTLSRYTTDSKLSLQNLNNGLQSNLVEDSSDDSSGISEDDYAESGYFDFQPNMDQAKGILPSLLPPKKNVQASMNPGNSTTSSMGQNDVVGQHNFSSSSNGASKHNSKGNIFFIPNSPSLDHETSRKEMKQPINRDSVASKMPGLLERKDSLFANATTLQATSESIMASSLSSTDISEVSDIEDHPTVFDELNMNSLLLDSKFAKSARSSKLMDENESEWMSVSSESELASESPVEQPISFAKRMPIPRSVSEDSSSSPPADDTLKNSPSSFKPRSLLSGLFLNELDHGGVRSPDSTKSANFENPMPKPVLKRSSTTGVITFDSKANTRSLQRPSLFLSKRYGSASDFSKKTIPERSPILFITEEEITAEAESKATERNLIAKQTSSVGLSNFLVTANAATNSPQQMEAKNGVSIIKQSGGTNGADSLLSNSLSKYSTLQRQNSLKNLFSKSSINLSSLLGSGITGKLRLNTDGRSSETIKSLASNQSLHAVQPMASLFAEHLSQQSLIEESRSDSTIISTKSLRVEPKVIKDFTPSIDVSESLKDSLMIDHKLGKAPLPDRVVSNEDLLASHNQDLLFQDSNDYHSKGW